MSRDVAPDGSPVALYRKLPPGDEPETIHAAVPPGSDILELGAGAGRVTHALIGLGHPVVAVDESPEMLAHIGGAEYVASRIEVLALDRTFSVVLLGGHLVNTADDEQRQAFLGTCRRHVRDDGLVLIERHDPAWAETPRESSTERAGAHMTLTQVERRPPFLSAVMLYEIDGAEYPQPFTARILDDAAIARELDRSGLRVVRHLSARWVVAGPAPSHKEVGWSTGVLRSASPRGFDAQFDT